MPTVTLQETKFGLSILPIKFLAGDFWARTEISIENEFIKYKQAEKKISSADLEDWIFAMFRLLAGAYKREYTLSFEEAGIAIDLYPHTENGNPVSREERRKRDCVMAIRLLMRSDKGGFLGGVYTLLLHREEIAVFASELRKEYDEIFVKRVHGIGKYMFVGVSPLGYTGCNYWYFDPSGKSKTGGYVWVTMGSHNTEQIVYVDSIRYFNEKTSPYPVDRVKQVLRVATKDELNEYENS